MRTSKTPIILYLCDGNDEKCKKTNCYKSEIDRLIAYNNEHGTNHAVDFAPKHDPKG